MRWTKLTGLEVDFDSDITSSTVTYPLPLVKSSQKKVVRTSGQNQGDETRSKIVEAMRKKPEISRRELAETVGISQSAIQKHIGHLKGAGIIIRLSWQRQEGTVEGVEIIWHIHVISCNNRVFRNLGTALQSEF